jgi:hypothetical protein
MSVLRHRGRQITTQQITSITAMIEANPGISRWKLSRILCEAWQWKQANGALRDMVCRSLLLELDRAGHIQLPAVRRSTRNYLADRQRPEPVIADKRHVRPTEPTATEHRVSSGASHSTGGTVQQLGGAVSLLGL